MDLVKSANLSIVLEIYEAKTSIDFDILDMMFESFAQ